MMYNKLLELSYHLGISLLQPVSSSQRKDAMQLTERAAPTPAQPDQCPIDHASLSRQKIARREVTAAPIECDAAGVWHVRGFEEARAILRGGSTKQAGFGAEMLERLPG